MTTSSAKISLTDLTVNKSLRRHNSLITPIAFDLINIIIWICGSSGHGVILETQWHHLWNNLILKNWRNRLLTWEDGEVHWLIH